jgi:RimJ/RimL family protein N-acetyltransferase
VSNEIPRFVTRRLYIEALRPSHAASLFAALADPRLYAYMDERPRKSEAALAQRYAQLERGAPEGSGEVWLNWAIRLRRRPAYIGTLQATIHRDRAASIAYVLSPAHWRFGYATEGVQWLLDHLATKLDVAEIRASVDIRNEASWRLLERLRFIRKEKRHAELHGEPSMDYGYRYIRPSRSETARGGKESGRTTSTENIKPWRLTTTRR